MRDLRAGVETAYYQVQLDDGLIAVNEENIANLKQVVNVTQAQYMGGQAQQSDLIGAELALQQVQLQQRQYETNRLNDRAGLNQLLYRKPSAPLELEKTIELRTLEIRLDRAVDTATHARQEILEAALTEKNSTTALTLAEMEYLPNYTVGYEFDYILQLGAQPLPNVTQGHTWTVGFNVPVFFWIHQREDVFAARHSLDAAKYSMNSVLSQTETAVTQLYQSAQYAYESAQVYRGQLIPLADKEFKVSLVAYQSGKFPLLPCPRLCRPTTHRVSHTSTKRQFFLRRRSCGGTGDGSCILKMKHLIATVVTVIMNTKLKVLPGLITLWLALSVFSGCDRAPTQVEANSVSSEIKTGWFVRPSETATLVHQADGPELMVIPNAQAEEGAIDTVRQVSLPDVIEATGQVTFDDKLVSTIISRLTRRIEEMQSSQWEVVNRGQLVMKIYSPDYMSAEAEYLAAAPKGSQSSPGSEPGVFDLAVSFNVS